MDIQVEKIKVPSIVEINQYTINGIVLTDEFMIKNNLRQIQKGTGESWGEDKWVVKYLSDDGDADVIGNIPMKVFKNDADFEKYFNTLKK